MAVPPLSNSFAGGSNGTTITTGNSGGASGDAWSAVSIGASGTLIYDNAHPAHGGLGMKIVVPATATDIFTSWQAMGSLTGNVFHRAYFYLPAYPATLNFYPLASFSAAAAQVYRIFFNIGGGTISVRNTADSVIAACNGAVSPALNTVVRFEWRVKPSTTVGEFEWRLYNTADSTTIDETKSATGLALAADLDRSDFGPTFGTGNEASFTLWMGDIAVSTVDWIGGFGAPTATHRMPIGV